MREELWQDGILYTREIQHSQEDYEDYVAVWKDYNPSIEIHQFIVV